MFLLSQNTIMVFLVHLIRFGLFGPVQSISVYFSFFGPLQSVWSILFTSVEFNPFVTFLSTLFNSIHLVHFDDALWREVCVEDELLHWKLCHLFNIMLVGSWFDPFSPLQWCIVRRSLCRKRSCSIDNYVMLSV